MLVCFLHLPVAAVDQHPLLAILGPHPHAHPQHAARERVGQEVGVEHLAHRPVTWPKHITSVLSLKHSFCLAQRGLT